MINNIKIFGYRIKVYLENDKMILKKHPRLNYYNGLSAFCILGPYAASILLPMSDILSVIILPSLFIVAWLIGWFFLRRNLL